MDENFLDDRTLRDAREEFAALIHERAAESSFQRLFVRCPYILSRALPLRVDPRDIVPLGRPGRQEPDFVFFPRKVSPVHIFGGIELKRPDSKILTVVRKDVVTLSRDAATGIAQLQHYFRDPSNQPLISATDTLFLGSACHLFVVMGLSDELTGKLVMGDSQSLQWQIPAGCRILPYDVVLKQFESTIVPRIVVLVPGGAASTLSRDLILTPVIQGLRESLLQFERRRFPRSGLRPYASVLIVTDTGPGEWSVLICRNPSGGAARCEWIFPGVQLDPGEDHETAAANILASEFGMVPSDSRVLGLLDDYPTRSGFVVAPMVVFMPKVTTREVTRSGLQMHWVSSRELREAQPPDMRRIPESARPVLSLSILGTNVHAPTGAYLYQFQELALHGRSTRVAHFETPVSLWEAAP